MTLYRVTAQSLEVLSVSAASARVTAQSLEALVGTYQVRLPKAVAYAVLGPNPAAVAVQKSVAYAVLDDGSVPAYDPHWASVVLLCHFDGTHNQTTSVDSSLSAHPLTLITHSLSTTQKKFGTAAYQSSGGGSGRVAITSGLTDFQFGSGPFTVEAWVYIDSYSGAGIYILAGNYDGTGPQLGWDFGIVNGTLAFYYSTGGTSATSTSVGAAWTPTQNTWHHVAVDRDASNVLRVYLNGAVHASATVSATLFPSTYNLYIGNDGNFSRGWGGYVDDLRITKGAARYGGAFAVPQAAFPDSGAPAVVATRRRPVIAICG